MRRLLGIVPLVLACGSQPKAATPAASGTAPVSEGGGVGSGTGTGTETETGTATATGSGTVAAIAKGPKDLALEHLAKGKELSKVAGQGSEKKPYLAAIKELEEAVALDPALAEAHFELGRARFYAGDREEAIASFAKCVSLAPDATLTYYDELAEAEIAAGTPEEALKVALQAEKHAPAIREAAAKGADAAVIVREDEALYRLFMVQAMVYEAQGKKDLRIAALEKTHDTKWPSGRDADYQLALAYHAKGKKAEACTALARFTATPFQKSGASMDHHDDAKTLAKKWGCKLAPK